MTERPTDIPEGVWKGAEVHLQRHMHLLSSTEIVARAVMAEREKLLGAISGYPDAYHALWNRLQRSE